MDANQNVVPATPSIALPVSFSFFACSESAGASQFSQLVRTLGALRSFLPPYPMAPWVVREDGVHEIDGYRGSYCDTVGTYNCSAGSPFKGDFSLDELWENLAFRPSEMQASLV